jgi:hypothetical protein
LIALPLGALAEHNQRIVARICALLFDEQPDELVEVDLVFGDDAADRGGVRRVERRKAGIAAEDAKNADRSCEATVVRWRWMASLARVIAVEKPMQYSVL